MKLLSSVALLLSAGRPLAIGAAALASIPALAQQEVAPAPWVGEMGITETVDQIMNRERLSPPRRVWVEAEEEPHPDRSKLPLDPASPLVPQWPWSVAGHNPPTVLPATWRILPPVELDNPQTLGLNQVGATLAEAGFIPPDSQGAVGPTQVLVCINGRIKVFDKVTGALGALNSTTDVFFNSVRNGASVGDPQVRFDRITNRWFVLICNFTSPNRICLAVSSGPTITGAASFTFYFFQQDTVTPAGNTGQLADYPSLGVDANALYTGANMFSSSFQGCSCWVIRKSSVLSGGPIVVTAFRNVTGPSGTGMYSPRGVDNPNPAATEGYFVGVNLGSLGSLVFRRISTPGATPTISANILLAVPATAAPIDPPAPGSSPAPEGLGDRLLAAQIRRNRLTNTDSLWTSHSIQVNNTGVASSSGGRDATRWYQIGNLTGVPTLTQSGTLFDAAATPINYFIPTVAATGQGHMAIGNSFCNATTQLGCAAAGRLSTDSAGSTQSATTMAPGAGNYQVLGSGRQRWGDYSYVSVDPNDDQSMWAIQEYCNATNSYAVRMTRLVAPPPCTPISCSPPSVAQGAAGVDVTVTGSSAAGSAFYDTDATYANRLAAAIGGAGVTVNSISFNHATTTQFTMNITVLSGAAVGARTVSATNPDGQIRTSATGILTITGAACYANCDGSTVAPILNANDFNCFLNQFANGDTVANCDGSTVVPVLNANDFSCFLNLFAAGCS